MNLKIHADALAGTAATGVTQAQEARAGKAPHVDTRVPGDSPDSIAISGLSVRISDEIAGLDAHAGQRVSELAAAYQRGSYRVDAKDLSQALVRNALSEVAEGPSL